MRTLFKAVISLPLWVILPVCLNGGASAQRAELQTFKSSDAGIEVSWGREFDRIESIPDTPASRPLLMLRHVSGSYPTINVLLVPGMYNPSDPAASIADSYRSVGLTDTRVVFSSKSRQGWPVVDLSYAANDTNFNSSVVLIPQQDSYFVLTLVDRSTSFQASKRLFDTIVSSVRVTTSASSAGLESGTARSFPPLWAVLIAGALIAAAVTAAWHVQIRRSRR